MSQVPLKIEEGQPLGDALGAMNEAIDTACDDVLSRDLVMKKRTATLTVTIDRDAKTGRVVYDWSTRVSLPALESKPRTAQVTQDNVLVDAPDQNNPEQMGIENA